MKILEDKRTIKKLWTSSPEEYGPSYVLGCDGVTQIEAYGEQGVCFDMPWFAIWKGEIVTHRLNAAECAMVEYATDEGSK